MDCVLVKYRSVPSTVHPSDRGAIVILHFFLK